MRNYEILVFFIYPDYVRHHSFKCFPHIYWHQRYIYTIPFPSYYFYWSNYIGLIRLNIFSKNKLIISGLEEKTIIYFSNNIYLIKSIKLLTLIFLIKGVMEMLERSKYNPLLILKLRRSSFSNNDFTVN